MKIYYNLLKKRLLVIILIIINRNIIDLSNSNSRHSKANNSTIITNKVSSILQVMVQNVINNKINLNNLSNRSEK